MLRVHDHLADQQQIAWLFSVLETDGPYLGFPRCILSVIGFSKLASTKIQAIHTVLLNYEYFVLAVFCILPTVMRQLSFLAMPRQPSLDHHC